MKVECLSQLSSNFETFKGQGKLGQWKELLRVQGKFRQVIRADTAAMKGTESRDFYKPEFTGLNFSYTWGILRIKHRVLIFAVGGDGRWCHLPWQDKQESGTGGQ